MEFWDKGKSTWLPTPSAQVRQGCLKACLSWVTGAPAEEVMNQTKHSKYTKGLLLLKFQLSKLLHVKSSHICHWLVLHLWLSSWVSGINYKLLGGIHMGIRKKVAVVLLYILTDRFTPVLDQSSAEGNNPSQPPATSSFFLLWVWTARPPSSIWGLVLPWPPPLLSSLET